MAGEPAQLFIDEREEFTRFPLGRIMGWVGFRHVLIGDYLSCFLFSSKESSKNPGASR